MNVPRDLKYTSSHEWIRIEGAIATVGITDFAQHQLSDLTFVELPAVNDEVAVADEVAVVESVKAASDVYAPLSGVIVAANQSVVDRPELINSDPYGEGWLFKIRMADKTETAELMTPDEYEEQLPEEE